MRCVHFIGFTDTGQYWRACQIWGKPDFIHRHWDLRAKFGGEYHPDDIMVFAKGTDSDEPKQFSFNDSEVF